mmetsp:Transcript_4519/g.10978  ORF Transcript_4519/g.10978 Transcript_4519/m.10978 type:complete len:130 (+) Transcript_4519:254-643(+)
MLLEFPLPTIPSSDCVLSGSAVLPVHSRYPAAIPGSALSWLVANGEETPGLVTFGIPRPQAEVQCDPPLPPEAELRLPATAGEEEGELLWAVPAGALGDERVVAAATAAVIAACASAVLYGAAAHGMWS